MIQAIGPLSVSYSYVQVEFMSQVSRTAAKSSQATLLICSRLGVTKGSSGVTLTDRLPERVTPLVQSSNVQPGKPSDPWIQLTLDVLLNLSNLLSGLL